MNRKLAKVLGSLAAIVLGVVVTVLSLRTKSGFDAGDYIETTAVVTDVQEMPGDDDSDETYDLQIEYKAGSDKLTGDIRGYSERCMEGDEITIYYDKNNPSDIVTSGATGTMISIAIGIVVALAGLISLVLALVRG